MTLEAEASQTPPAAPGAGRLHAGHLAAVTAGNALEFYDFLVYSTFALYIGRVYFPAQGAATSLLLSLGTFGIGFVTRPLGGLVLGWLGDRVGRKPAMLISFGLMGLGMIGLAATPSYAQIGLAAPVLVILARLVQGLALGGEVGPSTAYLVETAAPGRRGLIGSLQAASQGAAILAAAAVGVLISFVLPPAALEAWGWRLAFAAGLVIVPFGLIARRRLPDEERPAPRPAGTRGPPIPWPLVGLSLMLIASGTINTYVNTYMVTYAIDSLHLPARAAFLSGVMNGFCVMIFGVLGGWLSDRFGRRAVMIGPACALVVLPAPIYWLLLAHPSTGLLMLAVACLTIPSGLAGGAMLVAITESFPRGMRCMTVGLIYAIAIAVFGGTTQFAVGWLIHVLEQPLAPAYYRVAASLVGLAAVLSLRESAPAKAPDPAAVAALSAA